MAKWDPKPLKSVTICGLGASVYTLIRNTHDVFPPDETPETHQVWTLNSGCKLLYHDVCFDMHTDEYLLKQCEIESQSGKVLHPDRTLNRRKWMKEHPGKTIVMAKADPEIPNSFTYPLKQVVEASNCAYFDTGLAYMIAAAIHLCKVENLGLYGCDYAYNIPGQDSKEFGQACAEFWVGIAKGMGVNIYVPALSSLLNMIDREQGRLYGYHEPLEFTVNDDGTGKFIGPDYD
jgi:hypothetical protein